MKADRKTGAGFAAAPDSLARRAGRGRLDTVRTDFFLDPAQRLTEQERALMTAMLQCLVSEIAGELRSALPDRRLPASDESDHALIERLGRSGLLDDAELLDLLLRRADEERIASAASARSSRSEARVLQGLVAHDDGAVSAAAMALILARGRRRDRYGQCLVTFDDLPPIIAKSLVHRISAALRFEPGLTDGDLALASKALVERHDPAQSVDSLAASLAEALKRGGAANDGLFLAAAHEGEVVLLGHLLARGASIPGDVAQAELLSGDPPAIMALFRLAGLPRTVAAGMLAAIGDLLGVYDPAAAMKRFDSLEKGDLDEARRLLTSDPDYRAALAVLEADHG